MIHTVWYKQKPAFQAAVALLVAALFPHDVAMRLWGALGSEWGALGSER